VLVCFRITVTTYTLHCKHYNSIFMFVRDMPETLLVTFFPDAVYLVMDKSLL